jgi:hypothetical protein
MRPDGLANEIADLVKVGLVNFPEGSNILFILGAETDWVELWI